MDQADDKSWVRVNGIRILAPDGSSESVIGWCAVRVSEVGALMVFFDSGSVRCFAPGAWTAWESNKRERSSDVA